MARDINYSSEQHDSASEDIDMMTALWCFECRAFHNLCYYCPKQYMRCPHCREVIKKEI